MLKLGQTKRVLPGITTRSLLFLCLWTAVSACGCRNSHATLSYQGREENSSWRRDAAERIEKFRKGNILVTVVDGKGKAVSSAHVDVRMLRHSFSFGAAVSAAHLMDNSSDGDRYRQTVERLYNKVVLENDLKWGPWDSSFRRDRSGQYDIDNTFRSLRWLNERGIQVRGHYLAWGNLDGDAATVSTAEKSPAQFRSLLLRHAEQKMVNVGNAVSEWDVVNHPFGWVSKNIRDVAGDDIYDEMFMKAKEWNPEPRRYINEGGILTASGHFPNKDRYLALIKDMLGRGVPVQGVGFMGHFFADNLTPPTKLLEILDHYAVLGLPLQVTEFDVRYGKAGEFVKLTAQQEKLQADYLRDFMITMFSHPSVTGVIMWGFWEGRHWYPSAALYRKDWSIKPNGRVWEDLVLRQWWTNEVGKTDAKGRFATRGFLGDYAVTVHLDGHKEVVKQFRLDPAGTTLEITVK